MIREEIARHLLEIGAIEIRPNDPFTWSSGIKSPIYCDNRLTLSYPKLRKKIATGLAQLIQTHYSQAQVIAGTATAGIPHAAWVADLLDMPMVYVRSSAKGHGKQNLIEGRLTAGQRVVVVEDLISTGGSSLAAVDAIREVGATVEGVTAIFTYGFNQAEQNFSQKETSFQTLTDYQTLLLAAQRAGKLTAEELDQLSRWKPL